MVVLSINVSKNDVLTFTFLGFISQKVTVSNKTVFNISLKGELSQLQEVVVGGIGTFSGAGNDPLVLIDGLNDVDPNNIKSISILKDAASASIYGTRAANGVILIETKSLFKNVK